MSLRKLLDINNINVDNIIEGGTLFKITQNNKPIIYLHPKEKYYISDLYKWFKITKSEIKGNTIYRVPKNKFRTDSEVFDKNAPIYVYYRKGKDKKYIDIVYSIFFNYNGSKRILGLVPVGAHDADLEQFIVRVDEYGNCIKYLYSTHGDFQMFDPKDIYTENAHPLVYAAINSHALYRKPGSFFRIYGLGNDITMRSCKKKVIPKIILLQNSNSSQVDIFTWPKWDPLPKSMDVNITRGCFGSDGVSCFNYRKDEKYKIVDELKNSSNCFVNTFFVMTWILITYIISYYMYKRIYNRNLYMMIINIFSDVQGYNNYFPIIFILIIFYILCIILKIIITLILKFFGKKIGVQFDKEDFNEWVIPIRWF